MFTATRRDPRVAGKMIVFAVYALLMFFFAGLPLAWMLFFFAFTTVGGLGAYITMPHFRSRIQRFGSADSGDTYQTDRSLEAISNGGLLGQGNLAF